MVPNVRKIHFLGDRPSTQYRNKLMFQLMRAVMEKVLLMGLAVALKESLMRQSPKVQTYRISINFSTFCRRTVKE
nr:unnamed protein product [Callosobruchus chinensis]